MDDFRAKTHIRPSSILSKYHNSVFSCHILLASNHRREQALQISKKQIRKLAGDGHNTNRIRRQCVQTTASLLKDNTLSNSPVDFG